MLAAVTFSSAVVAVHVMAVVAAFGVLLAAPLLGPGGVVSSAWMRLLTPGAVLVFLTGAYVATDRGLWAEPWVSFPMLLLLAILGIVHAVIVPAERRLSAGDGGAAGRWRAGAWAGAVLVLVSIFLMVTQPG
jgi:hypothetical protein